MKHKRKKSACICALACVLCVPFESCKVQKQSASYAHETGVAGMYKADSLRIVQQLADWSSRKLEIRHISYIEPDSTGRQFIRSVTLMNVEEEAGGEASSSLQADSQTQARVVTEKEASRSEKTEAEKKSSPLAWIALIVTLAVLFIVAKRVVKSITPNSDG